MNSSKWLWVVYAGVAIMAIFIGLRFLLGLQKITIGVTCGKMCILGNVVASIFGVTAAKIIVGTIFLLGGLWAGKIAYRTYLQP
jgi:hypothetical protein